jgi:hypothetical protein
VFVSVVKEEGLRKTTSTVALGLARVTSRRNLMSLWFMISGGELSLINSPGGGREEFVVFIIV